FFIARTLWYLAVVLVPIALGIALLRGRIYDRATIQRHALIFGGLTLAITIIYLAAVEIGVNQINRLINDQRLVPIAYAAILLSILLCVFLFQPLRLLVQNSIDQVSYPLLRAEDQSFAGFGETIYDNVQLDALSQRLLALLQTYLRPHAVALLARAQIAEDLPPLPLAPRRRGQAQIREVKLPALQFYACAQTESAGRGPSSGLRPLALTILPEDPLRAALLQAPGPLALERFAASPAAGELLAARIESALALVDRGEVVGIIVLSDYPAVLDERDLLAALASQVAPVWRVAERLHQQDEQNSQRERVEQEMQMARRIQHSFLPQGVPALSGWQITPFYQPAREVGGDFYDFIALADGHLGLVIGDVTGKGVPAALVMATTRTMIRVVAQHASTPHEVLAQVNDLLCPDLPASMYVTCFYAVLDPASGGLRYANAGHELPFHRQGEIVRELRAAGMPLGLMPAMTYDEGEAQLQPGDDVLLYSDGIVEAHNRRREMFGEDRLQQLVGAHTGGMDLVNGALAGLTTFSGVDWEQEDDITMIAVQRSAVGREPSSVADELRLIDAWSLPSAPGNERLAMRRVSQAVRDLEIASAQLAQLETAVAEATLNAMEHGNNYQDDKPVEIAVLAAPSTLVVRITDQGSDPLDLIAPAPDLAAKLAEEQSPRGWGLFLIKHLVDEVRVTSTPGHHVVELRVALGSQAPVTEDLLSPADVAVATPSHDPSPEKSTSAVQEVPLQTLTMIERSKSMQPSAVTLTVRQVSSTIACIDVQGDITGEAEAALMHAYNEASTPATRAIILNFTGLVYMNSLGIGLLVTLLIRMKKQKQSLFVYGLSDHYRRIFQLTRLDDAIIVAATEADAVSAASQLA
ncbi:MAG TPA: anti-sigma factor antagonist, partial [Ktedonobacterales bacterium]|nr:anti-sigma factor antagonist [Ktedonobacterales bacterium]